MNDDRGISTVVDVAMALLLITASVLLIGLYLSAPDEDVDEDRADRTANTLSESTISVEYSLEEADPIADRNGEYTRTDYGSATGLLADAAVANVRIDGVRLFPYATDLEDAVDASIGSHLVGSNHDFYVIAEWEPYDNASIGGTATAGERPPPDEDVSSVTMTTSSGIPPVDEGAVEEAYLDAGDWWNEWFGEETDVIDDPDEKSFEAAGMVIAQSIIEGYFPPEATQMDLESQGISHELTVYHYERMVVPLGYEFTGLTNPDTSGPLHRKEADAVEANRQVLRGIENADTFGGDGLGHWIGDDLRDALSDEIEAIDEEYDDDAARDEAIAELIADAVSTGTVTVTVQTWHP